jgi:hypothetical protein
MQIGGLVVVPHGREFPVGELTGPARCDANEDTQGTCLDARDLVLEIVEYVEIGGRKKKRTFRGPREASKAVVDRARLSTLSNA